MEVTLPGFERVGVVMVGNVMLNRYWCDSTSHVLPEAPVPVVKVNTIEEHPGGAVNMAMNIISLGANTRLVGLTGTGDTARTLNKSLVDVNVKCDFVSVPTYLTVTRLRILSRNQQLIYLDFEKDFEGADPQPPYERISQALSSIGALVPSNYARGALASVQQMIQLARKADAPVLTDPKGTDFECYRDAMLLTPNLSEFKAVIDKCKTEEEIAKRGTRLIADYELSAPLVTRSGQDMSLLQPGRAPLHIPTQVQGVCDVTGAGDTVIGVLATTLAADDSLEEACFFANAAASVVVGKLGASTVSPIELESAVRGRANTGFGVTAEKELRPTIMTVRKRGEKVVMTNGVFDTLHAGYISYLANARKLGDRLIVAVNSNTPAKQLKGNSCPANPLEQRMAVLGVPEAVDQMVSFEESTPQHLIAGILPDLLVKDDDYKPEETAGSKEVWANGGEVLILSFKDDHSTTSITKKIQLGRKG